MKLTFYFFFISFKIIYPIVYNGLILTAVYTHHNFHWNSFLSLAGVCDQISLKISLNLPCGLPNTCSGVGKVILLSSSGCCFTNYKGLPALTSLKGVPNIMIFHHDLDNDRSCKCHYFFLYYAVSFSFL